MSTDSKEKKVPLGGQALMEGVMMRSPTTMALAVRNPKGDILLETQRLKPKGKLAKIPVLRGVVSFASSLVVGMSTLMRSAQFCYEEEKDTKHGKDKNDGIGKGAMALALILGMLLALGLFFFIPGLISGFVYDALSGLKEGSRVLLKNLISGTIRVGIFVGYLLLVSLLKDIRRNFMYHGAEHKTINCYEKGLPLTVQNVKSCSTRHNRCGTTFMFLVMLISIVVFAFVDWGLYSFIEIEGITRNLVFMVIKLLFLPLVAGLSYEVLFAFAKMPDNLLSKILRAPGLGLQRLTTKEPDEDMINVALTSFNAALEMHLDPSIKERSFDDVISILDIKKELLDVLNQIGAEPCEADWLLCYVLDCKRSQINSDFRKIEPSEYERLKDLIQKRKTMPLDYCIGHSGFYGHYVRVDSRVLIPRMETEILAQEAIAFIKELEQTKDRRIEVLDLCTGSGCIALALSKETNALLTAVDVSKDALEIAKSNLKDTDAEVIESDLFYNLKGRMFDLIVCNPPYIESNVIDSLAREVKCQPHLALDGGEDGLNFYRKIIPACQNYLKKNGRIMFEVGFNQASAVSKLLISIGGFSTSHIVKDLQGIDRVVIAA